MGFPKGEVSEKRDLAPKEGMFPTVVVTRHSQCGIEYEN